MTAAATRPTAAEAPAAGRDRWHVDRRQLVLALAGVTTFTEVLSIAGLVPDIEIGGLPLSMSLLPALALGLACGSRLLGRSTVRRAAVGFWVIAGGLLVALFAIYVFRREVALYWGLIFAALDEELVYRLAVPAVVAAALRMGNVRPNAARIAGLALGGLWWALLPGHIEQMDGPTGPLPYLAFAALGALIVYRSGSVLPMAIGHAISNLLTVLMWSAAMPADARSVGLASVLALLVLAYGRPARITHDDDGGLLDTRTGLTVTAIDLRDGQPALVELEDGRVLPVHRGMVRPASIPVVGDLPSPERAS